MSSRGLDSQIRRIEGERNFEAGDIHFLVRDKVFGSSVSEAMDMDVTV